MKALTVEDLKLFEYYFFVYNGLVYYGMCTGGSLDYDEPTVFEIVNNNLEKECCCVWEATLIYTL